MSARVWIVDDDNAVRFVLSAALRDAGYAVLKLNSGEQRMVSGGEIYARAYICARLVSKEGPVSNEEIFAETGQPPAELVLPEWIHEWRLNNSLPSTRRPASASGGLHSPWNTMIRAPSGTKGSRQ